VLLVHKMKIIIGAEIDEKNMKFLVVSSVLVRWDERRGFLLFVLS